MSPRERQSRFVYCVGKLIVYAYEHGYELTWGDTYPGKFKHKATGMHPLGLAVDLNLFRDGRYLDTTEDHAPLGHQAGGKRECWEVFVERPRWASQPLDIPTNHSPPTSPARRRAQA